MGGISQSPEPQGTYSYLLLSPSLSSLKIFFLITIIKGFIPLTQLESFPLVLFIIHCNSVPSSSLSFLTLLNYYRISPAVLTPSSLQVLMTSIATTVPKDRPHLYHSLSTLPRQLKSRRTIRSC